MSHLLRHRPSPVIVVAVIALCVAIGGGAYAAIKLPANSVGSKQLKRKAVTPAKVAPATIKRFKGTKGDTGATGPSDVYADGTGIATLTSSDTAYGQVTVPAGSYLLLGKATFNATATGTMHCVLGADPSGITSDVGLASAGPSESAIMSLSGVQTFASAQTVKLLCSLPSGSGNIADARVIAIKTQALHGSTPID